MARWLYNFERAIVVTIPISISISIEAAINRDDSDVWERLSVYRLEEIEIDFCVDEPETNENLPRISCSAEEKKDAISTVLL